MDFREILWNRIARLSLGEEKGNFRSPIRANGGGIDLLGLDFQDKGYYRALVPISSVHPIQPSPVPGLANALVLSISVDNYFCPCDSDAFQADYFAIIEVRIFFYQTLDKGKLHFDSPASCLVNMIDA